MPHSFYFDVLEALAGPGCAFCRLGTRTVSRHLDHLAYENVNDYDVRATIRDGLGLCNRHAWQFVGETRDLLGAAIIYRDLLRTLQRQTAGAAAERVRDLTPRATCVACDALATEIADCAQLVREHWTDDRLRRAFEASVGLCWRHLLVLLERERSPERRREMAARQRAAWARRIAWARGGSRWMEPARGRSRRPGPVREECAMDLPREAVASARGMNGVQIAAEEAGAPPAEPLTALPESTPGRCPVCAAVTKWLATVDPAEFPCAVHAWPPAGRPSTRGPLAPLPGSIEPNPMPFADLAGEATLARLEARLDSLDQPRPSGLALPGWTRRYLPPEPLPADLTAALLCATCRAQLTFEVAAVEAAPTVTLCLPHLRLAARHAPDFPPILTHTRQTWHQVERQLDEYIRKQDYRFQHEPLGEEQEAPGWAVALVAGDAGIR